MCRLKISSYYIIVVESMLAKLKEECQTEYQRYSKKKLGKLVAAIIYYVIFSISPIITSYTVPFLLQYMREGFAYAVIVTATIAITELLWCGFMTFVYKSQLPFFEQYRVDPKRVWPWEEDAEKWKKTLLRSAGITAFNVLIFAPINLIIQALIDFRVTMNPQLTPSLGWILPQIFLMMVIEDFIFFTFHLLLHKPFLYKYHKIHHQYYTTVSIAGLHFHVLQFFLIQSVSFMINMRIALLYGPMHISTVVSWFILRIWDANIAHSGYDFSWAPVQLLPFCTNDQFHDFHHSKNAGNYASQFRVWDIIFGTNNQFSKFKRQQSHLESTKQQ